MCYIYISIIKLNLTYVILLYGLSHVTLVSDLWRLYIYGTLECYIFCKRVTIITPEKQITYSRTNIIKQALSEDCPSTTTFHLHPYSTATGAKTMVNRPDMIIGDIGGSLSPSITTENRRVARYSEVLLGYGEHNRKSCLFARTSRVQGRLERDNPLNSCYLLW